MDEKSIGRLVSILYRQSQQYINCALKRLNVSSSEFIFMMALYNNEGISQENLSELLQINKAATARGIKSLEQKGFVYRIIDEKDRRAYKVYTTDKGKSCKEKMYTVRKGWTDLMAEGMDEETFNTIYNYLKATTERVQRIDNSEFIKELKD